MINKIKSLFRKIENFFRYFLNHPVILFVSLFVLIFLSRLLFSYGLSPELRLKLDFANDANHSIFLLGSNIANGNGAMASLYQANGLPLALIFAPFYILFNIYNFLVTYYLLLFIAFVGYLIFIYLLTKKESSKIKFISFLFFFSFILGISGSTGIYMGNIDIILSLLLGFLIFGFMSTLYFKKTKNIIISAFVNAFILISKIFLLPFSLIFGIFSSSPFLFFLFFIIFSFGFLYIPNIFGANMSIWTYIESLNRFNNDYTIGVHNWGNHSLAAISTLFLSCSNLKNCPLIFLSIIKILLAFIVIILPMFPFEKIRKLFGLIKQFLTKKIEDNDRINLFIFLLSLSVAVINLIPTIAYEYRLFYSLPIVLILLIKTKNNKKANFYCLLSMALLLIKGLWIAKFNAEDIGIIDFQFMNLFVLGHFYFLIKSSFENLISDTIDSDNELKYKRKINIFMLILIICILLILLMVKFIKYPGESNNHKKISSLEFKSNCIGCNINLPKDVVFPEKSIKSRIKNLPYVNTILNDEVSQDENISNLIIKNNEEFYNLLKACKNGNESKASEYYKKYVSSFKQVEESISSFDANFFDKNQKYIEWRNFLSGQYSGSIKLVNENQAEAFYIDKACDPIYKLLFLQTRTLNLLSEKIWEFNLDNNLYRGRLDIGETGVYECNLNNNYVTLENFLIDDKENNLNKILFQKGTHKIQFNYLPKFFKTYSEIKAKDVLSEVQLGKLKNGLYDLSFEYGSSALENFTIIISKESLSAEVAIDNVLDNKNIIFIDNLKSNSINLKKYKTQIFLEDKVSRNYYFYLLFFSNDRKNVIIKNFKFENKIDIEKINIICNLKKDN